MDASNRDEFRVRTGLDEVVLRRLPARSDQPDEHRFVERVRHARTERVVEIDRPGEAFLAEPEVGDLWEPLTVHARLHRLAAVFRKLPHTPDTKPAGYRSCMPEPVREIFKDARPGEPMRLPVNADDYRAAMALLDVIVSLTDDQRLVLWGLACKLSNRRMGKHLHCHHLTVAKRKIEVLDIMVRKLNTMEMRPDERDIEQARELIHRKLA